MSTSSSRMAVSQSPTLPPESRQPLRERCQVSLTILPISYRKWNKVYNCNCGLVFVMECENENQENQDGQEYTPSPSPTPSLEEESHLVEIMEGLYIALADDEADVPALRTFDDEPFTHVLQVNSVTLVGDDPLALSTWRREEAPRNALVQRLSLVCPAVSLCCAEQTVVGPKELRAARDFLSLALPHGSTKWWPEELRKDDRDKQSGHHEHDTQDEGEEDEDAQYVFLAPDYGLDDLLSEQSDRVEQDDNVNVLIVAPTSRAVDVLTVLFCYLAFLEDTTPEDLVEMDYCDEVWEEVAFGPWSMMYVDLIARCN